MRLLLIHSSVKDILHVIGSLSDTTDYIIMDENDTKQLILSCIKPNRVYHSVGIMKEHEDSHRYSFYGGYVHNVEEIDPELHSWREYRKFLVELKDICQFKTLDLIECNMFGKDMKYVLGKLSRELAIHINATDGVLGKGNWLLGYESLIGTYLDRTSVV